MPKRIDSIEPNGHDRNGGDGQQRPRVAATGATTRTHPETGEHGFTPAGTHGPGGGAGTGASHAAAPPARMPVSTAGMTPAGAAASEHVMDMARFPRQGHMQHVTPGLLWFTFFLLVGLLVVTVGLYFIDLQTATIPFTNIRPLSWIPGVNLIVALMVATLKAGLVVWNFMNVRNGTRLTWLYVGLGFVWLLVIAGIFMDYQSRAWLEPPGWE